MHSDGNLTREGKKNSRMSLTQFVWNLAGMESQIPEEDLPEESELNPVVSQTAEIPRETTDGAAQIDSSDTNTAVPASPSSFSNLFGGLIPSTPPPITTEDAVDPVLPEEPQSPSFLGMFFGSSSPTPEPTEAKATEPLPEEPQSPSFLGAFFGSSSPSPEPTETTQAQLSPEQPQSPSFLGMFFGSSSPSPEPQPAEAGPPPESESAGIGGFFSSLMGASQEKVGEPSSPAGGFPANGPSDAKEGKAFDQADADDVVTAIENGKDPSKRVSRLFVVDQVESQLKLLEAKAAMRKLKEIRKETSDQLKETLRIEKAKEIFDSMPSKESKDVVQEIRSENSSVKVPVVTKEDQKTSQASLEGPKTIKAIKEASKERLDHYESIKKALALLPKQTNKKGISNMSIEKQEKLRAKSKPLSGPHRAFHSFEPFPLSSSARILEFPANAGLPLHTNRGIPSETSPSLAMANQKASIVVTSVESRPVARISHIF